MAAPVDRLLCAAIPDPAARAARPRRRAPSTASRPGSARRSSPARPPARTAAPPPRCASPRRARTPACSSPTSTGSALLWRAAPNLVADLAEDRLAPLEDETEARAPASADTLLAWLRHDGHVAPAAAELGVHAQTVRYRLGRLRERFGAALDDPDARFELELALRAR